MFVALVQPAPDMWAHNTPAKANKLHRVLVILKDVTTPEGSTLHTLHYTTPTTHQT